MRRRQLLSLGSYLVLGSVFKNSLAAESANNQSPVQSEFEAYQQGQSQQFENYQTALNQAFLSYKKIQLQAFNAYKKAIAKRWSVIETSSPQQWVTYDPDLATKVVVDYQTQQLRIDSVLPPSPAQQVKIEALLKQINQSNLTTLIERDPVDKTLNQFAEQQNQKLAQISPQKPTPSVAPQPSSQSSPLQLPKNLPKPTMVKTPQGQKLTRFVVPLSSQQLNPRERKFIAEVDQQAQKWQLEPSLILAITKTESAFNPLAKSHIPAFGLMQIVPRSAGLDASQLIYGEAKLLSPNFLYTPENNIHVGSAYLYILQTRYLKNIQNPTSQLYCMIASYNTGAGNVAKTFTGSTKLSRLSQRVNQMSPQQVHAHLLNHLPHDETKHYLKRVLKAKAHYDTV